MYPVARVLELPTCRVIMSTQEVREEALVIIRCIVKGYYHFRFELNVGEVFTANKRREERENAYSFPLWTTVSNFKRFCFWLTFSWNMCGWEARTRTNF